MLMRASVGLVTSRCLAAHSLRSTFHGNDNRNSTRVDDQERCERGRCLGEDHGSTCAACFCPTGVCEMSRG
jgi:hypothetical protein